MNDETTILDDDAVATADPNQSEAPATNTTEESPSLPDQLSAAQAEAKSNLDGWQRALADLANARKRFDKQTQLAHSNAVIEVVTKLLPVIDDFERAMANTPPEIAADGWYNGLGGIMRKLNNLLESLNVERITAVGEPFDPNLHDALSTEASPDYESGIIIREFQAGYRLGERVVRPTLVVVAG